ncbi:MAG: TRAP transporter substrate-binding protein [Elusimicrobia bacterium]|nr:TRAP transporter substrate-binding protein [Elusimicrobiota bacterium]
MNRRSQAVLSMLAFLITLAAPASAANYKIHWYLGHQNLDYFEEAARDFKKAVETASKGDISVDIVLQASDAPQGPGQNAEVAAKVASGEIEMGHSFVDVMGETQPKFHAFEAPYLFRGYRHMEGAFEGPVGAEILGGLRAQGIEGLSFTYSGGANGIATTKKEIREPKDLKGMKIACFGDKVDQAWLKSLGATPVALGHDTASLDKLAQSGAVDGVVITWRNLQRDSLDTAFNYFNLPNSSYLVSVTYINKKYFESMPKAYQELITKASLEAGRIERARTIELNENARREMTSKGVRAVNLTDAGRKAFTAAVQPAYKTIEGVVGKDLVEKIKNTKDAAVSPLIPEALARAERTKVVAGAE